MSLAITLLLLFYVFFKVGLFTFGGGYAMIPLIEMETLSRGWITYDEIINFIGISEMTFHLQLKACCYSSGGTLPSVLPFY